jgi:hypothetical protein
MIGTLATDFELTFFGLKHYSNSDFKHKIVRPEVYGNKTETKNIALLHVRRKP